MWANAYAARNRVHCEDSRLTGTLKAVDIPLTAFLPSSDDYDSLKDRMRVIVTRILAHHLPFFRHHSVVDRHVRHRYSSESAATSELVRSAVICCKEK